jgi:hypothetical protein
MSATSAEMYARIRRHQPGVNTAERAASEASQEALLAAYYAQLPPDMQNKLIEFARMLSELTAGQAK